MVVNYTLFALFLSCPGFGRERVQSYSKQELCCFAHLFCCAALSAGRIRNLISFANSSTEGRICQGPVGMRLATTSS